MKIIKIIAAILLSTITASAQIKLTGFVKDTKGKIVTGASVLVKDSYDGGITDSLGRYSFKTFETGQQTIVAKTVGYKTVETPVTIATENISTNFNLKEEVTELKAVTVTAGSFEASDRKKASTVLSTLDVLTTGGGNADIVAAVKTLPGAQQVNEQEGLFVRGGTAYETKQFIDGTVVNNPFNASVPDLASRGRFSPFLFKGTVFSTGGYSALYGQALSSALILESIDLPDQSQATASISSVVIGAGVQELAKNKKSSWGINYNYTNLAAYFAIVKQKPDYFHIPEFHATDANFRVKTNGGMVKFYSSYAASNIGLRRSNIDSLQLKDAFGIKNHNFYNNISWKENLGNGWKVNTGFSFSTNSDDLFQQIQDAANTPKTTGFSWIDNKNFTTKSRQDLTQIRTVFDKRISGISVLHFGGEYWYNYIKTTFNNNTFLLKDNFAALFGEADLYITNDIAAKIGARFEHSSIINKANIAPRISVAYKTSPGAQMSLVYGEFYQKPENNYLYSNPTNLGYVRATHYLVNYIKNTNDRTFRVEAFYKKYHNLITTPPTNFFINNGSGYAQGLEIFWRDKKTFKGLDYWVSYSYLDSKRQFNNYPSQLQPTFAASHTASLVVKKFIPKISTGFNFTYSYATGRPYYNFAANGNKYDIRDQGKTKDYNNLGFSLNYLTKIGKAFAVIVASANNILNTDLIYGYNYNNAGTYKEAIRPAAPQFYFIGVFLSWGVDKRQDAINNNL
ncbi:MAG: TonB-dependent receptor [Deinococcales bacterium]|nr:TonB-dependent receptor [Chitinophagaceae bacterium]